MIPLGAKDQITPYRADIDGLRAIAIAAVVMYHADVPGFAGGFIGVDIFFVISGFLIASILLTRVDEQTFSFREFYERRVRRIVPPLIIVLLASSATAYAVLPPDEMRRFGNNLAWIIAFGSNFSFWRTTGYFEPAADTSPLVHTWSLGVEEQFYLIFPLIFVWLVRRGTRVAQVALACAAISSFLLCVYLTRFRSPAAAFYLLPTRAWELLVGASLTLVSSHASESSAARNALSLTAIVLLVWGITLYDPATPFPGLFAALPVLATAALIDANRGERSFVGKVLGAPPLVAVGLISYSLYLWHWPLLVFARHHNAALSGWQTLSVVAASVVLASLSWRIVERPARDRVSGPKFRTILWGWAAASTLLLAFAASDNVSGGWRSRYPPSALAYLDGADDRFVATNGCLGVQPRRVLRGDLCAIGSKSSDGPQFVLWGDSHAGALIPVLDSLARFHHVHGLVAVTGGCPPLLGVSRMDRRPIGCSDFNAAVSRFLQDQRVPNVILAAFWSAYSDGLESNARYYRAHPFLLSDPEVRPNSLEESRAVFRAAVHRTIAELRTAGLTIFLIEQTPWHPFDVPRTLASAVLRHRDVSTLGISTPEHRARQAPITEVFASVTDSQRVFRLDPANVFCSADFCLTAAAGRSLYADDNHLSRVGAMRLHAQLNSLFEQFRPAAP